MTTSNTGSNTGTAGRTAVEKGHGRAASRTRAEKSTSSQYRK